MPASIKGIMFNAEVEFLAAGGRATPQSNENNGQGRDRIAFGPEGAGAYGRDRFAGGETSYAPNRMLGGKEQGANLERNNGPVLGVTQFNDDYRGGVSGGGIQDRNAGGAVNVAIQDRNAAGADQAGIQDRNAGGMGDGGIQDRMQGGGSAEVYKDRYQGALGGPNAEDRYEGMERGGFERGQLDLPEDVQGFAAHRLGVARRPLKSGEPLKRQSEPVYETVQLLRNVASLRKRITSIKATTADIKNQLPSALWATAPNEVPIKVSSRLKIKHLK